MENMREEGLPKWVRDMSDEEWETYKKEDHTSGANCGKCGKRLLLTLCNYNQPEHYCIECCPEHLWQTTHDWPVECARCGINYISYLESVLNTHMIPYNSSNWVIEKDEETP